MHDKNIRERLINFTFYAPALFFYTLVIIVTSLLAFYYSFTNWDGFSRELKLIGFQNYWELFHDPYFYNALRNTFLFAIVFTVAQNVIGLLLAAFYHKSNKINNIAKFLVFLPVILSPIVVGFIWNYIYSPIYGIVGLLANYLPVKIGLGSLTNPKIAIWLVALAQIWQMVGFAMIIYAAGLKDIPEDIYESAAIDGAGKIQAFWYLTLPLLAPATTILVVFDMITSLKVFDLIYIMTNGGPGYATETFSLMIFREAFKNNTMGYATTVGVALFIIVLLVSLVQIGFLRKREVQY
ncbi:MAG TPA: sugar ABC transporter permease [Firmicutes bacterium]|jgi:raffinose/stachyose/melibiose transport system permease protein|nr:sugar ABC transporter permease [Bacillota bacterium]